MELKRYFTTLRWEVKHKHYGALSYVSIALKKGPFKIDEVVIWKIDVTHIEIQESKEYILYCYFHKVYEDSASQDSICDAESHYLDDENEKEDFSNTGRKT